MSESRMNAQRRQALLERIHTPSAPLHIVGLGRFGGNISLIQYLAQQGHQLILWESSSKDSLRDSWNKLIAYHNQIEVHWSNSQPKLPTNDWIFITPAMPFNHPSLEQISKFYLSTEIEVSLSMAENHDVDFHAILGSVGKSTCASLLARALKTEVVGNIGKSFLECLPNPPSELVIELSSFQLHYLKPTKWIPKSFLVTPIDDHHSDWHGGLAAYQNAKLDWVRSWQMKNIPGVFLKDTLVDPDLFEKQKPKLIGQHNYNNLQAVWALTKTLGRQNENIKESLLSFTGLPHRLELCLDTPELKCYNDSKATSPSATLEALSSFEHVDLLILQGQKKDLDYSQLLNKAKKNCDMIWLVGGMREIFQNANADSNIFSFENLEEAFSNTNLPVSGNILFSPAAPSYGDYENYEQRGEHFKALISNHYKLRQQ